MTVDADADLTLSRVRSSALQAATGRGWSAWLELLDGEGAAGMSHPELVTHLERVHGDGTTSWWRQSLAVGYAQARGGRLVGQTRDAGFQVGVQRTLPLPLADVWDLLLERTDLWLGAPVGELVAGQAYDAGAATGQVRVVRPHERLRLTWQPAALSAPATLQLTVTASGADRTAVHVHLEKLPDAQAREQVRAHWREVLQRLVAAAG